MRGTETAIQHRTREVELHAILSTGGGGPYRRDLLAVLAQPEGAVYSVRWGEAYVVSSLEELRLLDGKHALFAVVLDDSRLLPLRVVKVYDVEILSLRGRDESFARITFVLGPWPVVKAGSDPPTWPLRSVLPTREDRLFPARGEVQTNVTLLDPPRSVPAHFASASWARSVSFLKEHLHHRDAVYVTVEDVIPITVRRQWQRRAQQRAEHAALRGRDQLWRMWTTFSHSATQRHGKFVIRSGRTYRIRLVYYDQQLKDKPSGDTVLPEMAFGLTNLDRAVTQVGPDQRIRPGVFERGDVAFTARVTRRKTTVVTLSVKQVAGEPGPPTPDVPVAVELRPRISQRVSATLAAIVAVAATITGALVANSGWHDALLVLGPTSAAALIAYALRPE